MEKLKKLLYTGGNLSNQWLSDFKDKGFEVNVVSQNLTEKDLSEIIVDVEAYILAGSERVTDKVINSAKKLKVISFLGVGYESFIDIKAASKANIVVTNAPNTNSQAVAEFTFALILDAVRSLTYCVVETKSGKWPERQSWNLEGKTLGVIGMGAIGSRVAKIGRLGFGMDIIYYSRSPKIEIENHLKAQKTDLQTVFKFSDVITIHIPYKSENFRMIGENQLNFLKSSAIIVNMSNPEIIDPVAIKNAIFNKKLSCFAMDGYYIEPIFNLKNDKYEMLSIPHDRFLITPHSAYNTIDSINSALKINIQSIINIFENGNDKNIVN